MAVWLEGERLTIDKHSISTYERHDRATSKSIPRAKRLPETLMRQKIPVEALRIACILPLDERECHNGEVDQLASGDERDEPTQDFSGVVRHLQEGQESDS